MCVGIAWWAKELYVSEPPLHDAVKAAALLRRSSYLGRKRTKKWAAEAALG